MNEVKHIDIAEPIWKTKSVGLAVDDVPMGQNVKVTISYKRKGTGELLYPGEYIVSVDEIRKFPVETIRGSVRVHIIPISNLAQLTVINNPINKKSMLFGSSELKKIVKESEEAKAGNYDNKKQMEPGKYILTLDKVTLEYAKSDKNPMIVIELSLDDEHRTIREFFKIAGPNTDIPREKLVKSFHRGFGYEIQPCNTEADLINQLTKFVGKKLTVAVKGRKKAYSFQDKDKNDVVMEQTYPEFWYCGSTSEFDDFYIDMAKSVVPLSDDDKKRLVAFAQLNGGPYIPKTKAEPSSTAALPAQEAKTPEPVKIEEIPSKDPVKKEEPVKAEAAAPVEEEKEEEVATPEKKEEEGEDDFPF